MTLTASDLPDSPSARPAGLADAEVVAIKGVSSLDFLHAAFDCTARGQVFAISRPDSDLADLVGSIRTIDLPDTAHLGWGQLSYRPDLSDAPAQIVFTSGTEGTPKPIVLSHRNLADTVARLNAIMGVTDEIREYIGVPVTYSFGLGRVRAVSAVGGRFFLPDRFDPVEIRTLLEAGEINAISAVPSLWQVVLANPDVIGDAGAAVRWIEIGSQHMSGDDKAAMVRLFPNAKIIQHYGLSEASRATFLDISASDGDALTSVGAAVGDGAVRIDADGAIQLRGAHVALGRLGTGGGITPLTDADGWLTTRDRGEIRDGRLYFLGRLDNQINVSGVKLAAETLEADIAALVTGADGQFAITSVPDALRGQGVLLAIDDGAGDAGGLIEAAAKLALKRRGVAPGGVLHLLRLDDLPRTGTDKIQRNVLRDLYQNDDSETPPAATADTGDLNPAERALTDTWRKVIGSIDIAPDQTFYDAGGDSLSSVQIGIVMEAARYNRAAVRATLEGRPVADVARLAEADQAITDTDTDSLPDQTAKSWAVSLTRGVMVLSVLLSHWGPGLFGRLGIADQAERYISVFYRMGTPGFATIFGIGIGFFMWPGFTGKRASVMRRLNASLVLVGIGIVLGAALELLLNRMQGLPLSGLNLSHAIYGVLVYYAIALASAGLWLPLLARMRRPILPLLFAMPLFWIGWQVALAVVPVPQLDSIFELPRLMLIAGYNVFKMTALAVTGMAAGIWLAGQDDARRAGRSLLAVGALGALICVLSLLQAFGPDALSQRSNPAFVSLPGLLLYSCLGLFMLGGFMLLALAWTRLPGPLRTGLQLLIVTGGLALPIYVFHGLVIPARDVLALTGLTGGMVLAIPLALFLALAGYGGWRLHRMYFG